MCTEHTNILLCIDTLLKSFCFSTITFVSRALPAMPHKAYGTIIEYGLQYALCNPNMIQNCIEEFKMRSDIATIKYKLVIEKKTLDF